MADKNGNNLQDKIAVGDKIASPKISQDSVLDTPTVQENTQPVSHLIMRFAHMADEIPQWGRSVRDRDLHLRSFWVSEPILSSAVYSVSIRNASFDWEIVNSDPSQQPHKNTIQAVTRMLQNADRGEGWISLMLKTCSDLYTQDNGAFWELIRAEDSPSSPVLNIGYLDAGRCMRTGDPEFPVIYTDRKGRDHALKWYQVQVIEEFPSPIETLYNVQLCAVSRALRSAQVIRDIAIYKREKVGGRNPGSIHLVSGITRTEVDDALAHHNERMNNMGHMRYSEPVVIPAIDPTRGVDHKEIPLASLPDNFDEDTTMRWYIANLAMAFGVDYQEFAPLPAGNIGSSGQSDIMHLKTRGKGPAVIMKMFERIMNGGGILPSTVRFQFKVQDLRAEQEKATAAFERAKDRSQRILSGELDVEAAREIAWLEGDLPEHIYKELKDRPVIEPTVQPTQDSEDEQQNNNSATTGGQSQFAKAADIDRIEVLSRLRETGEINLGVDLPELTQEEIKEARTRLAIKWLFDQSKK